MQRAGTTAWREAEQLHAHGRFGGKKGEEDRKPQNKEDTKRHTFR